MPRKPISLGWGVKKEGKSIWTRNANKGVSVKGERRKRTGKIEWRRWDPYKSKVAAALLKTNGDPSQILPDPGSVCLYLGASSGTTVSHIHDHVCGAENHHNGQLMAIEISPRMMRDLQTLAEQRKGLIPVLTDARDVNGYATMMRGKAQWIHQDLSIADQAQNFISIAEKILSKGGTGILSLKAATERSIEGEDESRFARAESLLRQSSLDFIERIDIEQYQKQHAVFHVRNL